MAKQVVGLSEGVRPSPAGAAAGARRRGLRRRGLRGAVTTAAAAAAVEGLEARTFFAVGGAVGLSVGPNINVSRMLENQTEATVAIDPTNPNRMFIASNIDVRSSGALDDVDTDGDGIPDARSAGEDEDDGGGGGGGGGVVFPGGEEEEERLSDGTLMGAFSTDGGATWQAREVGDADGLPPACCDPTAAFDNFGNLFLAYIDEDITEIVLLNSTDGGQTFSEVPGFAVAGAVGDQPTLTTGNGVLWITYQQAGQITAAGAPVTGLGQVGTFSAPQVAPNSSGGNFGDIAVGPHGEVVVTYQNPTSGEGPAQISTNTDPDGLGPAPFGPRVDVVTTQVGGFDFIPAQNNRSVDAEAGLAFDRSGGPFNGRLYMVYANDAAQERRELQGLVPSNQLNQILGLSGTGSAHDSGSDLNIFLRYSDDQGKTWSLPSRVNSNTGTRSTQFLPRLALDQTNGNVGVVWHDTRNDAGLSPTPNDEVQFWGTAGVPTAQGVRFTPDVQISQGSSIASRALSGIDFGDYVGLDFHNGILQPAWADNSNSTLDNPSGGATEGDNLATFDVYTARVTVSPLPAPEIAAIPAGSPLAPTFVGKNTVTGGRSVRFQIVFTSPAGVDASTIEGQDLLVVGPRGFSRVPTLKSVKVRKGGTQAVATYELSAPGNKFDVADNGNYAIYLQPNAVRDLGGQVTTSGLLTQFIVNAKGSVPRGTQVVLTEDFNDGVIDPTKFRSPDVPTQNFTGASGVVAGARVTEAPGRIELVNRAVLSPQGEFQPFFRAPVVITGDFTFIDPNSPGIGVGGPFDVGDTATVATRSNGVRDPATGDVSGLLFRIAGVGGTSAGGTPPTSTPARLVISEKANGQAARDIATVTPAGLDLAAGDTVRFRVTDDGTNVTLEVVELTPQGVSVGSRGSVTATSVFGTGGNQVAFYNAAAAAADDPRVLALDNLEIAGGVQTLATASGRRARARTLAVPSVSAAVFSDAPVASAPVASASIASDVLGDHRDE